MTLPASPRNAPDGAPGRQDGRRLRIAVLGMWGMNVPQRHFGGFESALGELAPRLVERGHDVTIYCRRGEYRPEWRVPMQQGIRLVYLPSPGGKNLSGVISTLLSVLHAVVIGRFDLLFFVNVGMGFHCALARLLGERVVLNVDGLDWTRSKWGPIARRYFYLAARAAVRSCNRLVTDAFAMQRFYREHFGKETTMIAYGAYVESSVRPELIQQYGVRPREYYLIVSRLIPENNLELMVEAYLASGAGRKLVLVGGATYESAFHQRLRAAASDRVIQTGHIHDQALLKELYCNSYAYLHGHSSGGTNPALLRAMGHGSCVLAADTVFNREVLQDTGLFWPIEVGALTSLLREIDADAERAARMRQLPPVRIRDAYSWEQITTQYESLFVEVVGPGAPGGRG